MSIPTSLKLETTMAFYDMLRDLADDLESKAEERETRRQLARLQRLKRQKEDERFMAMGEDVVDQMIGKLQGKLAPRASVVELDQTQLVQIIESVLKSQNKP